MQRKMIIVLILEAIVIAAMVTVTLTLSHTHPARSMLVGILCLVFNIIMYASPLTIMKTVIRTKSVKYMPVCISIGNLLNGSIWVVYAALEFDPFIMVKYTTAFHMNKLFIFHIFDDFFFGFSQEQIPNAVGAVSGMIQIGLYVKYYKTTNWSDDQSPNEIEMPPSASNA
ncbi:putative SWEET sugar transporter [Helianthus annuus]|nr:putative SWEET sugar transporter [Helianthus annuus]KAJ0748199.1 putative SWEET sugar transporter [Helianthus annuus]